MNKKEIRAKIESLTRQHSAVREILHHYREAKNWKNFEACQAVLCSLAHQKINLKIKLFRLGGQDIIKWSEAIDSV